MKQLIKVLIFFPIGLSFLWYGTESLWETHHVVKEGIHTTGTIIEEEVHKRRSRTLRQKHHHRKTTYAPVVEFRLPDGTSHIIEPNLFTTLMRFTSGTTVGVYYHPKNPSQARIDSPFHLYGGDALVAGVGGIIVIFSLSSLLTIARR